MEEKLTGYIAGIARGHNAGVCLLKDGEIVFSIEEERLTRIKYDGAPLASITKILEYTDEIDYLAIAHTKSDESALDFTAESVYSGLARKLRLINSGDQVVEYHDQHHMMHASCAFYRSGFEDAGALVIDGAGSYIETVRDDSPTTLYEIESIYNCSYPNIFTEKYKHFGSNGPFTDYLQNSNMDGKKSPEVRIESVSGIVKIYEAVTRYCGWQAIEAGKTMGLFPYGKPNDKIPKLFSDSDGRAKYKSGNVELIRSTYPNGSTINASRYDYLDNHNSEDLTLLQNRRDMAYAVQTESQEMALDLIRKTVDITGNKNIVLSGGYGLNCVANYHYLDQLKNEGINLYVEPISNDGGTAMGAALLLYHSIESNSEDLIHSRQESLYLGPQYNYSLNDIKSTCAKYSAEIETKKSYSDVIKLLRGKNIVAMFQGRSENGPRALGNRSILFDPTFEDGKDFVNEVKHREYFRPFAGTVLEEHAHDWFDLRGMDSSPSMMYAVNCKEGKGKLIPSIIHVDGSCRIQTVNAEQNEHFYNLINEFYKETKVPVLFNTSFNLGGEPLVETLDDAIRVLINSDIEHLYMPEYELIITLSNDV